MKNKLNQRQERFTDYGRLRKSDRVFIMAGYSPKRAHVTGSELVRNRKVSEKSSDPEKN